MSTELQEITWQSMDGVLETRNVNGHLEANMLCLDRKPTVEDMDGFDRVLCFVKGKIGGSGGDIQRTEVFLTEENNYTETFPAGRIEGEYEVIGRNAEMVNFAIASETLTFTKPSNLESPGTYNHIFAVIGEDWAEIFVVQIVVTVPLRVQHNNVDHVHGQTISMTLTATNSPQYLYVFGSRDWILEGVEPANINVSPTSGSGHNNQWDSSVITIQPTEEVEEPIATAFRILAQTQWVDVNITLLPATRLQFVAPRSGEVGAPAGNNPVYLYL